MKTTRIVQKKAATEKKINNHGANQMVKKRKMFASACLLLLVACFDRKFSQEESKKQQNFVLLNIYCASTNRFHKITSHTIPITVHGTVTMVCGCNRRTIVCVCVCGVSEEAQKTNNTAQIWLFN